MALPRRAVIEALDARRPTKTYSAQMLDCLQGGGTFTGPEAYELFGVWSVAGLIAVLRSRGWQIDSDRDPDGRARYSMTRTRRLAGMAYDPIYRRGH